MGKGLPRHIKPIFSICFIAPTIGHKALGLASTYEYIIKESGGAIERND
jgi:hypothetical protein